MDELCWASIAIIQSSHFSHRTHIVVNVKMPMIIISAECIFRSIAIINGICNFPSPVCGNAAKKNGIKVLHGFSRKTIRKRISLCRSNLIWNKSINWIHGNWWAFISHFQPYCVCHCNLQCNRQTQTQYKMEKGESNLFIVQCARWKKAATQLLLLNADGFVAVAHNFRISITICIQLLGWFSRNVICSFYWIWLVANKTKGNYFVFAHFQLHIYLQKWNLTFNLIQT